MTGIPNTFLCVTSMHFNSWVSPLTSVVQLYLKLQTKLLPPLTGNLHHYLSRLVEKYIVKKICTSYTKKVSK